MSRSIVATSTILLNILLVSITTSSANPPLSIPLSAVSTPPEHPRDMTWLYLPYSGIPRHQIRAGSGGMRVSVMESAGILAYILPKPTRITGASVKGTTSALIRIPAHLRQGEKNTDDYVMRFGLIYAGDRRLGPIEAAVAPNWLVQIDQLCPDETGIDHISLFALANKPAPTWKNRKLPGSYGLIHETISQILENPGEFSLDITLEKARPVIGIWIACDGDDTKSSFDVNLTEMELHPENPTASP